MGRRKSSFLLFSWFDKMDPEDETLGRKRVFGKVEVILAKSGQKRGREETQTPIITVDLSRPSGGYEDDDDEMNVDDAPHEPPSGKRFRPSIQLSATPISKVPLGEMKGPCGADGAVRWDFTADLCAGRSVLTPPCPSTELFRHEQIKLLRSLLESAVRSNLYVEPQPETMNRWLLAQVSSTAPTTGDPLLRHPEIALETDVLKNQLMLMVPGSAYVSWNRRQSTSYILSVAERWCHSLVSLWCGPVKDGGVIVPDETADELKKLVNEATGSWLKRGSLAPPERALKLFHQLIDNCKPLLVKKCATAVEEVGKLLVTRAVKSAERIANYDLASYEDEIEEVQVIEHPLDEVYEVKFRGDSLRVTTFHAKKLRRLYELNRQENPFTESLTESLTEDLEEEDKVVEQKSEEEKKNERLEKEFNAALYVLLRRYQTLFGAPKQAGKREGAMFHAAAPETLFRLFREDMGVMHEGFASPFNCYFRSYGSAFPDTDGVFGSSGSFFDFRPRNGVYEVGPPYTEEVMEMTAKHCISLLEKSDDALTFWVFVPDWRKPLQAAQALMEESKWTTSHFIAEGYKHAYIVGDQHLKSLGSKKDHLTLPFPTHVYLLQNEKGKERWEFATEEWKEKVLKEMGKPV